MDSRALPSTLLTGWQLVLVAIAGCGTGTNGALGEEEPEVDPYIHIAFHDGFEDDSVVVLVNGSVVFSGGGVTTDPRISLAESFEVDRPNGDVIVEVRIPDSQVSGTTRVEMGGTVFVGVSREGEVLTFRVQDTPFGYV